MIISVNLKITSFFIIIDCLVVRKLFQTFFAFEKLENVNIWTFLFFTNDLILEMLVILIIFR